VDRIDTVWMRMSSRRPLVEMQRDREAGSEGTSDASRLVSAMVSVTSPILQTVMYPAPAMMPAAHYF
jgi:hypothetical protein